MELGDQVEQALTLVGITQDRVATWLGRPCGCEERKEKLNQLSSWAKRILKGKMKGAEDYLQKIIGDK